MYAENPGPTYSPTLPLVNNCCITLAFWRQWLKLRGMKLTFLGATGTVTGSKYLVETHDLRLLVDAGLFQGIKDDRARNWAELPIKPEKLDALLLTHAHIDHSGYIPRLTTTGFTGPVYCSPATLDLCRIMLPDSGHLQEDDAEAANRYGYSRHAPALPLYTQEDAEQALKQFKTVPFGQPQELDDEVRFTLHRAGHILGASFIRLEEAGTSILFSGDIGRYNDPVLKAPAGIQDADYVVIESTYGDRLHDKADPTEQIGEVVSRTIGRGGSVVIPAFAVGRAQSLLYHLYRLKAEKRIPDVPVYLDSPMAISATTLMQRFANDHRLSPEECAAMCDAAIYTRTAEASRAIHSTIWPKVIISASGMATGGRVLHHLKECLGNPRNTILLAGFQAAGTRGDKLARGERELRIHGQDWPVKAEIVKLDSMSAHADYDDLLRWLGHLSQPPKKVFITHGEPAAAASLQQKISERFGWPAIVPALGDMFEL